MTFKQATLALALCLSFPLALAESDAERWYQVEILLFENPDQDTDSPEQWPTYPTLQARTDAVTDLPNTLRFEEEEEEEEEESEADTEVTDLTFGPERPVLAGDLTELSPFTLLGESEYQLAPELEAMSRSSRYRPLFHQAWVQPVSGRDEATLLKIRGGQNYGEQAELEGYLELYVERYFHLTTDLQLIHYTRTDNPFRLIDDSQGKGLEPYEGLSLQQGPPLFRSVSSQSADAERYFVATESISLQQRRRMRSGELHYLDNPEFGMLILITPLDINGNDS